MEIGETKLLLISGRFKRESKLGLEAEIYPKPEGFLVWLAAKVPVGWLIWWVDYLMFAPDYANKDWFYRNAVKSCVFGWPWYEECDEFVP